MSKHEVTGSITIDQEATYENCTARQAARKFYETFKFRPEYVGDVEVIGLCESGDFILEGDKYDMDEEGVRLLTERDPRHDI